jgi:hypothetical protein
MRESWLTNQRMKKYPAAIVCKIAQISPSATPDNPHEQLNR